MANFYSLTPVGTVKSGGMVFNRDEEEDEEA